MKLALQESLKLGAQKELDQLIQKFENLINPASPGPKPSENSGDPKTNEVTESGEENPLDLDKIDKLQDEVTKAERGQEMRKHIEEFAARDLGICTMHPDMIPHHWRVPYGDVVDKPLVNPMRMHYSDLIKTEQDLRDNYVRLVDLCQIHRCLHRYCLKEVKLKKEEKDKLKTAEDLRKQQLVFKKGEKGESDGLYQCRFGYPSDLYGFEAEYHPSKDQGCQKIISVKKPDNMTLRGAHVDPISPDQPDKRVVNFPRNHPTVNNHIKEFLCMWQANTDSKVIYDPVQVTRYLFKYVCKAEKESLDFRKVARAAVSAAADDKSVKHGLQKILIKSVSKNTPLQEAHLHLGQDEVYADISQSFRYCSVGKSKAVDLDVEDMKVKATKPDDYPELFWKRHTDPNFQNECRIYNSFLEEGNLKSYFQRFEKTWIDPVGPEQVNLYEFVAFFDKSWKPDGQKVPVIRPSFHKVPSLNKKERFEAWARVQLLSYKADATPDNIKDGYEDISDAFVDFLRQNEKNPRLNFLKEDYEYALIASLNADGEIAEEDAEDPVGQPENLDAVIEEEAMLQFGELQQDPLVDHRPDQELHQDLIGIHNHKGVQYEEDDTEPVNINHIEDDDSTGYDDPKFLKEWENHNWQEAHDELQMTPEILRQQRVFLINEKNKGASKDISYNDYNPENLNSEQKMVYDIFAKHLIQANDPTQPNPEQKLYNVDGPGGSGKSWLLNCLNKLCIEELKNPNLIKVGAFTGTAAFNVDGETIHGLFRLPINFVWRDPAPPLNGDALTRLQQNFKEVQLLVIDEKSMVGSVTLYQMHKRLCEAKPENADKPFGGVSVILMGDFDQLPPVLLKPMFAKQYRKCEMEGKNLYLQFDKVVKLSTVMRQQGSENAEFRDLLTKIAKGRLTLPDWEKLCKRQLSKLPNKEFFNENAIKLCTTNKDTCKFNIMRLYALKDSEGNQKPIAQIKAINVGPDAKSHPPSSAGGLFNTLLLAEGARVMCTYNLAKNLGIVNGKST